MTRPLNEFGKIREFLRILKLQVMNTRHTMSASLTHGPTRPTVRRD